MINLSEEDWLKLAQQALIAYKMPNATVAWLAYTHNAVFAVQHRNRRYVLRLTRPHNQKDTWRLTGELSVLHTLRKEAGLSVPESIDAPGKQMGVFLAEHQIWGILFYHLPGIAPQQAALTPSDMQRIGAFLAELHSIPAGHWRNMRHSTFFALRPVLDYDGLFSEQGMYAFADKTFFSESQQQVMNAVQANVKIVMDTLGEDEAHFGLIHGDLLLKNILFDGDKTRALDFEFCGFGYFLYDLAPLLWQLKPDSRYAEWAAALWQGYTAVRALPARDYLEPFIAARQVASLRWLANNQHNPAVAGKLPQMVEQRIRELEGFLETGVLQRQNI